MRTMIQSGQELPQFEAVALIEERRLEPGLARSRITEELTNRSL